MKLIEEKEIGAETYVRIYKTNNFEELEKYIDTHWCDLSVSIEDFTKGKTYMITEYHDENRPIITIEECEKEVK